jgi:hypothetical protein
VSREPRIVKLEIERGSSYAAGDTCRTQFGQLAGMVPDGKGGVHAMVAGLIVSVSFTIANSSGGALTLEHEKSHDVIRRVFLGSSDEAWQFYHFQKYGGQCLRLLRQLMGKTNEHRTDETINNGASSTGQKLRFYLPFVNRLYRRPKDFMFPARAMKDHALELVWANGAAAGEFGAGMAISAGTVDEVSALIVEQADFVVPPKWSYRDYNLQQKNDSTTLPAGRKYAGISLFPAQSPSGGVASTPLTSANITEVEYTEESVQLIRRSKPQSIVSHFNDETGDDAAELPRFELDGANQQLPIKWPSRLRRASLAQGRIASASPILNLTGTITTTNTYLLTHEIRPGLEDDLAKACATAGLPPSNDWLVNMGKRKYSKVKSESKVPPRPDKAPFLPQVWLPNGNRIAGAR